MVPSTGCRSSAGSSCFNGRSMAGSMVPRWTTRATRARSFQWPKYGRVDGACVSWVNLLAATFQWPKYGRVDGAYHRDGKPHRRGFQWPKYGRVDGALDSWKPLAPKPSFNGRSMAGSMVHPDVWRIRSVDMFQWPKYGRVDGATAQFEVRKRPQVSMAEVWPGRWCRACPQSYYNFSRFQWPKYGRVDGALLTVHRTGASAGFNGRSMAGSMVPIIRNGRTTPSGGFNGRSMAGSMVPFLTRLEKQVVEFQWPKYGRVDGATATDGRNLVRTGFNGRSMAGSMVPGPAKDRLLRLGVSMAEVWPGRWCLPLVKERGRGWRVSMAEVWPGRWCLQLFASGHRPHRFNGRSMAGSMVPVQATRVIR